ncbi:MAG: aspartate ammonia-lyase [Clostridia bacterium]|nr:aspartate ammonia-lyase [Clostridia bacterium]
MFRKESDSVGTLDVPYYAYYGVQSLRGAQNFNISGNLMNKNFIYNITKIKKAAAVSNQKANKLNKSYANAIIMACNEVLEGKFDKEFITDAIQGGAGTTVNMNVNEVIANRATEILGGNLGEYICHPNDHVNMSQSTNDVVPTAGKLTIIDLSNYLLFEIDRLTNALDSKAIEFNDIIKMGRTQLEDAVPIKLGQEFSAYSSAIKRCSRLIKQSLEEIFYVNIGGTAIGTSINTSESYLSYIIDELSTITNYKLKKADNLIDSTQNLDAFVHVSGALKTCAITLSKMCNDFRLMASGPKTGISEIILPAMQNGSSIMPGKVNPVIPEVVSQVAFAVIGNDVTISMAAEGGQLELNAFEPIIFYKIFESLTCLANAVKTLTNNCVLGIKANKIRCSELLNNSVGIVTALCPYIGYKKSAEIAKEALRTNLTIKEVALKHNIMSEEDIDKILDPKLMI